MQNKRRRLSAEAWRGLVDRFERGGLPAEEFCERESIRLANLKRWQLKVRRSGGDKAARRSDQPVATAVPAEFVDLGALPSEGGARLELRLEFGGGVVLQLSRG